MKTSTGLSYRVTPRLKDFDYSSSAIYYVTLNAKDHRCIFGEVVDGAMVLNDWGRTVDREWRQTADLRPGVILDEYQIMPNHMHLIVFLPEPCDGNRNENIGRAAARPYPARSYPLRRTPRSLSSLMGGFKGSVTREIRNLIGDPHYDPWQGRFFDHVIRRDNALERIRRYIRTNPARWAFDRYNPIMIAADL